MGYTEPMDYYRQSVAYSPRPRDHRRHSPPLLTPEASRSSNGSLEEQVPRIYARNGMRICSLLSDDQTDRKIDLPDRAYGSSVAYSERQHHSIPRSPPYQGIDKQKPSLPPLKTVLNGTITSPPDTPPTQKDLFQPGPREPIFSASTYKPPALYPNKKARTENGLNPSPTLNTRSSVSSPGLPTTSLTTRPRCNIQTSTVSHGYSGPHSEHDGGRRQSSFQAPVMRSERTSPDTVNYQYSRGFTDDARPRQNGITTTVAHRSPEAATSYPLRPEAPYGHTPMAQTRPSADYFTASSTDRYALPTEQTVSRRSSVMSHRDFVPPRPVEPTHSAYPASRPANYALPMRDEAPHAHEHSHYIDRDRSHQHDPYTKVVGYQDAQPTFFMPSHYDYQHGKTRKRSNLPKQSTEIMKTWFDQNITNPYPSEEQKAVFSNATGISMTQVSNWFINHRRRCPELRDKRATRVGGLDGSD